MPSKYSGGKVSEVQWTEFQSWMQRQLDQKFQEQEAKIKEALDGLNSRSWQLGGARTRAISEMSAKHSMGADTELGLSSTSLPTVRMDDSIEVLVEPASPTSEHSEKHHPHVTRILGKEVVREKLKANQPFKAFVKKGLDFYMALVVLANLACIIAMTEWTVHQTDLALGLTDAEWSGASLETFELLEYVFFGIYLLDVLLRMATLRREWYFDQLEGIMYLNIFDGVLVVINLFELVALPMILLGEDQQQHATTIRVIKLVRIVRTLRIFKTVSLFRQLRILVGTCFASIGALFWSMVLLIVLQIGFALAICQALQLFILDTHADFETRMEMHSYYGSFAKALYTMFEITFSGSWPVRVRPVIEKVDAWYSVPFLAYITFVVFAVIKIVTALFLKETLTSAANDADMVMEDARRTAQDYHYKLQELFRLADDDGDGNLSRDEFVETMSLPSVQHYLRTLDMSIQDCRPLFDILDDGDGLITIAEFVKGLSQIKGQARAVDIVILQRENAKLLAECQHIRKDIDRIQRTLPKMLRRVASGLSAASEESETLFTA
mmetsp:Transcript_5358/g.12696  ORF Transcript_5358/g.12696 Transcript_5358/m.12696 type:complete len:553 (-) Transcript_5358:94-1752(-)|eukprot:s3702_g5.t1